MDQAAALPRPPIVQWVAAVDAPSWLALPYKDLERFLALPDLAGLDVRIAKRGKPSEYERELARHVLAAGKRLRCHTWMGVRAGDDGPSVATYSYGAIQGEQIANDALTLGAEAAGANSERDVYRGSNGFANPKCVDFVRGVADGFHKARGDKPLYVVEVGLAVPAWHYKKADLDHDGDIDTAIPAEVAALYERKGVMAYQVDDSPSIVEDAELRTALDRARKIWKQPMSVWLGVGRIDDHRRVWGDYAAAKVVLADRHAGIDEAVWYDGFGAIGQVLHGHPRHPPLVQVIPEVAAL